MPKKVLIIDDEPGILKSLSTYLKANGYDVAIALSGKEGIQKTKTEKPDLIMLDFIMPDMDGSTTAAMIKQNPATKDIPIIFVTCLATGVDENGVSRAKEDIFVAKPFKLENLLQIIKSTI